MARKAKEITIVTPRDMERWRVKCECGETHTEVYPDGLNGSESYSDPDDPKTCGCPEPNYELIERED